MMRKLRTIVPVTKAILILCGVLRKYFALISLVTELNRIRHLAYTTRDKQS